MNLLYIFLWIVGLTLVTLAIVSKERENKETIVGVIAIYLFLLTAYMGYLLLSHSLRAGRHIELPMLILPFNLQILYVVLLSYLVFHHFSYGRLDNFFNNSKIPVPVQQSYGLGNSGEEYKTADMVDISHLLVNSTVPVHKDRGHLHSISSFSSSIASQTSSGSMESIQLKSLGHVGFSGIYFL